MWVTSPRAHPFNVEWLRFESDSPVTGLLRTEPHVAYRVDNVHEAIRGHSVLADPFDDHQAAAPQRYFVRPRWLTGPVLDLDQARYDSFLVRIFQ